MSIIHTLKNSIKQEKIILILTLTNCDRVHRHCGRLRHVCKCPYFL